MTTGGQRPHWMASELGLRRRLRTAAGAPEGTSRRGTARYRLVMGAFHQTAILVQSLDVIG